MSMNIGRYRLSGEGRKKVTVLKKRTLVIDVKRIIRVQEELK